MKNLNVLQTLSIVGLIFSAIVQVILLIIHKEVKNVWALYPTWILVFIIGTLLRKFTKYEDGHHHH